MNRLRKEAGRLSRYGIVGLASNLLLYILFILLLWTGIPPVAAAGICYVAGVCLSYTLNRTWTFGSSDSHGRDVPKFLLAYAIGLCSTLLTIGILIRWMPPELAQILNVGLTAIVIYVSLVLLRFGGQVAD